MINTQHFINNQIEITEGLEDLIKLKAELAGEIFKIELGRFMDFIEVKYLTN